MGKVVLDSARLATTFKVLAGDIRVTDSTAELSAVTEKKEGM